MKIDELGKSSCCPGRRRCPAKLVGSAERRRLPMSTATPAIGPCARSTSNRAPRRTCATAIRQPGSVSITGETPLASVSLAGRQKRRTARGTEETKNGS